MATKTKSEVTRTESPVNVNFGKQRLKRIVRNIKRDGLVHVGEVSINGETMMVQRNYRSKYWNVV